MQKNKNISLAKVGMQRDLAKDSLEDKSYSFAINMNLENEDGDLYKLKSEYSNILASKFKAGFRYMGSETDDINDRTFVLLTNPDTGVSEFGVIQNNTQIENITDEEVDCGDCEFARNLNEPLEKVVQPEHQTYTTILEDSCADEFQYCLNLDIRYPVKNIVIKNEKSGTKVFFSDNYNPPRYYDESKAEYYKQKGSEVCDTDTTLDVCVNCDRLRMFPLASPLKLEPEEILLGGNLKLGQYSFYGAYANNIGETISEFTSLTQPVSIFDENNKILTSTEELDRTNLAIKLTVSNLDAQYDFYKIVVAYTNIVDAGTRYFEVGVYPATNGTVLLTTEQEKEEITINDILLPNTNITLLEGLSEINNYLVGYGVTREKEWNLQPIVNLMGGFVKWQTHLTMEDLYEDGVNVSKYKGYMRDEVYPFAISFLTNTGYTTARFPLISRPATDTDLQVVTGRDINSINANINNCESGLRNKRWQIYNTATEEGQCQVNTLPTTIVTEQVDRTSTTLVTAGEFVVSESYTIYSLGTTDFTLIGASANTVGTVFTATGVGSGTGVASLMPTSTSGSIIIQEENLENFTTLEQFINDELESGCLDGYDFCAFADPTSRPDIVPTFENCSTPVKVREDEVQVLDIVGEQLEFTFFREFNDYRKLVIQTTCNLYATGLGGNYIDDQAFSDEYKPDPEGENIWIRNYTFTNDRPRNALDLDYVDNPGEPLTISYFHNYEGYDSLTEALEVGFEIHAGGDIENNRFANVVSKKALWFSVDLEERSEGIIELVKGVNPGGQDDGAAVSDNVRLSFFDENSGTGNVSRYAKIINIRKGDRYKVEYTDTTLTVSSEVAGGVIFTVPNYKSASTNKKLYFAVEANVVQEGTKYLIRPTDYCFGVGYRAFEVETITASYTSISFERIQRWRANCDFEVPIVNQCIVESNKYGEFAYWESVETYPDNSSLYDSRALDIRIGDFTDPLVASEFQAKYASGLNQDRYILEDKADFTCKHIRH